MKTILVLSDTHGRKAEIEKLSAVFKDVDYIIHLGDGHRDMLEVSALYPEKTYLMKGNCDMFPALKEEVLETEGVRFLLCHGDLYGVKSTLKKVVERAKERDCQVVLYGHTHRAEIETEDGVLCVCPGSLRYPIHLGGSYALINVEKAKAYPVLIGND